mgnify:CR=1 FL=1
MTITENLTGVVKEDHERVKTVTDILEEVSRRCVMIIASIQLL